MALSKQLVAAKRQRTALPNSVKRRVILQDDHDPALPDNAPARPRLDDQQRVLAGQQSLVLSPPRLSTVFDSNDIDAARTDIASLKDKVPVGEEEVGRLVTVIGHNQHVIRIKARERQFTIGRHRSADFVIDSPSVSNVHGKVFAHTCDTGETLVCYEDVSRSGTLYNDEILLKKDAIILSHGDTLLIDNREFFYFHFANASLLNKAPEDDFWYTGPENSFPRHVEQYQITQRTLGSGSYARVHLAIDVMTGRQMACKVLRKKVIDERKEHDKVEQELRILTELKHANILSFVDACPDEDNWYLMLELCIGGDLHSYVTRKDKLGSSEALFITYQLLLSLEYLHHTVQVAHRDIKPENVLLRNRGPYPHVLISDFGTISREPTKPSTDFLGTLNYWSPECFVGSYLPQELDCFSLGCTIYAMLAGVHPFIPIYADASFAWPKSSGEERIEARLRSDLKHRLNARDKVVAKQIMNGCPPYHLDLAHVDHDAIDVIHGLLAYAPKFRLTIRAALSQAWIAKNKTELDILYARNVRSRPDNSLQSD